MGAQDQVGLDVSWAARRLSCRQRGFTLIELMVVVAIIGILAAIAVPGFLRFEARSRQAEAKIGLKGFYTAAKANFGRDNTFACGTCDWAPGRGHHYTYNLVNGSLSLPGSDDCGSAPGGEAQSQSGFTASADANIDGDPTCDQWRIDDSGSLVNTLDDVTH